MSTPRPRIPPGIWALGFVSLLTDLGSEMVHGLLPIMLVGSVGASVLAVGLLEGAAEGLAMIVKVFSGYFSDRLGRRKPLVLLGYGLAAVAKPLFPLADSFGVILGARLIDRFGKGIRGAPRDALISELAPAEARGASFGLRQSLDTVGAVLGPLLASGLLALTLLDVRGVLWVATIPGVLAVALILVGVREAEPSEPRARRAAPIDRHALRLLDRAYWRVVVVGTSLALARFGEAFLVLRASERGLADAWAPMVLVVMSLVYTLIAYPAGRLSDRWPRRRVVALGLVALIASDLTLGLADTPAIVLVGVALWGVHMGLSQGVLASLIADVTPSELRGTAFGLFNLTSGVAMLIASGLAGLLWQTLSPAAPFFVGAALALITLLACRRLP